MAEYYAVLSKAVASLDSNTDEARRAVYDKARNALIGQLKAIDPPLPTAEISRQRLELEEAIRRVERETGEAPPAAARAPSARPATTPAAQGRPQDVFRRAIEEAEHTEPEPEQQVERVNGQRDFSWDEDTDYPVEPPPRPANNRPPRENRYSDDRSEEPPRLVPNYDYEWDPNAPPASPQPRMDGPRGDPRQQRMPGRQQRPARARAGSRAYAARQARPSRLPIILLLVLIVAMVGGLAALAWSQRSLIADMLPGTVQTTADATPPPVAPPPADTSGKDSGRLLGQAPDTQSGVRDVTAAPRPADQPPSAETPVAQRAVLYEEPADGGDASKVLAFNASVVWQFAGPSGQEPEIEGDITVPDRDLKVRLHIRRNTDQSLPASHVVEITIQTGPKFAGGGIREVPRLVLKPAEDARGQPLVGASAKVGDGVFWIALSGVEADVATNLKLLSDREWIDLPLVYQNGQRAILTFEKGTPGDRAFEKALALWGG